MSGRVKGTQVLSLYRVGGVEGGGKFGWSLRVSENGTLTEFEE